MTWIIPFREEVTRDLAAAERAFADVNAEYAAVLARVLGAEARARDLKKLLLALNQIDPTTRIPEPPL